MGGDHSANATLIVRMPRSWLSDSSGRVAALCILVTIGVVGIVIGVTCWLQPEPYQTTEGWTGPLQCVVLNANKSFGPHSLCGYNAFGYETSSASLRRVQPTSIFTTTPAIAYNCSVCNMAVSCEAVAAGYARMELLPQNESAACMQGGEAFRGWYSAHPGTEMALVVMDVTVMKARAIYEIKKLLAPFIVGTGSLAILCSIGYMIYMSLIMAIYQEVPSDEVRASQCWAPSPCWGPNPSWKSQCKFEKIADKCETQQDLPDCCQVCLSASCGEVEFIGCGHAVVCLTCAGLLQHCPVCDSKIDGIQLHAGLLL